MDLINIAKQRYIKSLNTHHPPSDDKVYDAVTIIQLQQLNIEELPDVSIFKTAQKACFYENKISLVAKQQNDYLEDIDFSHNQLTYIPHIGGKYTFTLNLSFNKLQNCLLGQKLQNLCVLNLSNQPGDVFSDQFALSLQQNAPTLESLIVDNVNCVDLSFIKNLRLKQVSAKNNSIQELQDVLPYVTENLLSLNLLNNPVAKKRGLFELLCVQCQQIKKFNDVSYTQQQVQFAGLKSKKMQ